MKKLCVMLSIVLIPTAVETSAARAENLYEASLTGYTFMGGGMGGYQTEAGDTSGKNYLLIGSGTSDGDMWTFGWLKFNDLPTEPVASAILSLDYVGGGGMSAPGPASPMKIDIQAVDADVSGILSDIVGFKENHILDGEVASTTIGDAGVYEWDITSLVNGWIAGEPNYGFVVTGWDNGDNEDGYQHPKFAGLPIDGVSLGDVPLITAVPIPEPSSLALVFGATIGWGLLGRNRRAA